MALECVLPSLVILKRLKQLLAEVMLEAKIGQDSGRHHTVKVALALWAYSVARHTCTADRMTAWNQDLRVCEHLDTLEALQVTLGGTLYKKNDIVKQTEIITYDAGLKVADHGTDR